jgi:hypothetical protein
MTSTPFPGGPSERDGNSGPHKNEAPPEAHPEIEELSALSEGILPVERQTEVRAHLSECELCADVHTSLTDIRELLGTLPGPVRMPEDVASRIDAALAAEVLLEATTPDDDGAAVSRETATSDETAPSGNTVSRETGPSSAQPSSTGRPTAKDRPAGHAPASTGPGATSPGSAGSGSTGPGRGRPGGRRRRWRTITLAAAVSVVALGLGGIALQSFTDSQSVEVSSDAADGTGRQAPGTAPDTTGTPDTGGSSDDQKLRRRVQSLLSGQQTTAPSESGKKTNRPAGSTPSLDTKQSPGGGNNTFRDDRAGDSAAVPSCVRNGIHRSEVPLAVDPDATFEGRTGYLVVLPHKGGDPQRVDAYVIDPSCVSAERAGAGKVLVKRTYPRG